MTIKWSQKAESSWYQILMQINDNFGYQMRQLKINK